MLAAGAERTARIRLTSAVTVLSSDDPVRVFQDFATLDLLSGGRAEIMAGRGSFIESFPLFGYDLDDYDALFAEKLDLLLELRERERVTWSGAHRPPLADAGDLPAPAAGAAARSGSRSAARRSRVVRAGALGLPLALAIIGGAPERFAPLVDLYRDAARQAGHDPAALPVGINSHGFVAPTSQAAAERFFPAYAGMMTRIGRERGWPPMTRAQFDALRAPRGALVVGSPQEVIEKILLQHEIFGHQRFLAQMSVGDLAAPRRAAGDRAARHRGRARGARGGRAPRALRRGRRRAGRASSRSARRAAASSGANGSSAIAPSSWRHVPATAPSTRNVGNECGLAC